MRDVDTVALLDEALTREYLADGADHLARLAPQDVAAALEQLPAQRRAVAFRLLTKNRALVVFERLDPASQRELIVTLGEQEVAGVFDSLDPDDRVELLDELPAVVAKRLIRRLSPRQREATAVVLGYPHGSIGRRMSPEYVHVRSDDTMTQALQRIRANGATAETIYTLPVLGDGRVLTGVAGLRDLFLSPPEDRVADQMAPPIFAEADADAEETARRALDRQLLAMPIVDRERRLVGVLTIDDASRIVEAARDEDAARAGASEPLARPYLLMPIRAITRSRIVWLLVLAVSAILTVNVLELFEATLQQEVTLALFIPLLTGIAGNTGSQAATTVTRALATGEARSRNMGTVALKEARIGLLLGAVLGSLGLVIAGAVYDQRIGVVIALTLIAVCSLAATVGGSMPLIAKAVRVDPAVFSTPFISTFCDATGLLIYFSIAKAVLGI